ncbi:MAG: (d)CMP kinase [Bacillaceae bacterium]
MKKINIAIDGPAAAGKSTVAKVIAKQLGLLYIDTGAMYRALTFKALEHNINVEDEQGLLQLLQHTSIKLVQKENEQRVLLDGIDVSVEIRTPEVTNVVSHVAKHPHVRERMVELQRELAQEGGVLMDGRDIGTYVLPNADVKIFMIASVEERALRRHKENVEKGFPSDLETLKEEIALRDKIDSEREMAPLKKADDAIEFDTTTYTKEEVVAKMIEIIKQNAKNV